jgi:hypothetical protein
MSHCIV